MDKTAIPKKNKETGDLWRTPNFVQVQGRR